MINKDAKNKQQQQKWLFPVKFSADNIWKYFSYFSQKTEFDISCNGDSLHEMSIPVFWEK